MNLLKHGNGAIIRKSPDQSFFNLLFKYIYTHLHLCMRIFILGFMGTGKSTWAKKWGEYHQLQFIDLDVLIEKQDNDSVVDIFEKKGEDYFRLKEAEQLRTVLQQENCIVACGGGTPCFYENMRWMKDNGITVYLNALPNLILENVMKEKEKRPLLKKVNEAELIFFIEKKLNERIPVYNEADFKLDVENLALDSLKNIISTKA